MEQSMKFCKQPMFLFIIAHLALTLSFISLKDITHATMFLAMLILRCVYCLLSFLFIIIYKYTKLRYDAVRLVNMALQVYVLGMNFFTSQSFMHGQQIFYIALFENALIMLMTVYFSFVQFVDQVFLISACLVYWAVFIAMHFEGDVALPLILFVGLALFKLIKCYGVWELHIKTFNFIQAIEIKKQKKDQLLGRLLPDHVIT